MDALSTLMTVGVISLLAAISPGPDFFIVVKNSLSYSRKIGLMTACGVSIALLVHLSYTLFGLGALIAENAFIAHLLKYAGAGYLFYIGCKGLLASFKPQEGLELKYAGNVPMISQTAALKQGILTNLLNPKCALFFVSLFSQFIQSDTSLGLKLAMACVNWFFSLGWFLLLTFLITGNWITSQIGKFRMVIDRVMGALLMLLALKIMFT